jgi:hypothetical protein
MKTTTSTDLQAQISALQGDAWVAWNDSYHEEDPGSYRALGEALYRRAVHERIAVDFARLDEQNAWLDRMLAAQSK